MEQVEYTLLKSEVTAQLREIDKIFQEITKRENKAKTDPMVLESLGYKLHNLYCAFEDLFKILAKHFENHIQDLAKYHKELLWRMSLDIEGIRPALISEESFKQLDELRAFRHFFRHAYFYELSYEKLTIPLSAAQKLRKQYKIEIGSFLKIIGRE